MISSLEQRQTRLCEKSSFKDEDCFRCPLYKRNECLGDNPKRLSEIKITMIRDWMKAFNTKWAAKIEAGITEPIVKVILTSGQEITLEEEGDK